MYCKNMNSQSSALCKISFTNVTLEPSFSLHIEVNKVNVPPQKGHPSCRMGTEFAVIANILVNYADMATQRPSSFITPSTLLAVKLLVLGSLSAAPAARLAVLGGALSRATGGNGQGALLREDRLLLFSHRADAVQGTRRGCRKSS